LGLSNPLSFTISHTHSLNDRQLSFSKRACVPPLFWVFETKLLCFRKKCLLCTTSYIQGKIYERSDLKYFEISFFFWYAIQKLLRRFIFHLDYLLSCKNFCKDDKKSYSLQKVQFEFLSLSSSLSLISLF
jgi:hypothetical protein